jgi:dephospho-CoA kinase
MLLVGLTGGIGSGKSTVAQLLERRGAVVFDADALARKAVEPGTPGHDAVVERFGANVLAPGGELDREALASIVFADPAARRDLEAIVHPEVRRLFAEGC